MYSDNKQTIKEKKVNVGMLVRISMLAAIAVILMLFEIPLWFIPSFYKIDLSEVPVIIGAFSMGPLAGIMIELLKILLNLLINGSYTAGVGEFANFAIGCSLIVTASIIYCRNKCIKNAIIGLIVGTLVMAVIGGIFNGVVLLPLYAKAMMPMDALIAVGTKVNSHITDITTFVLYAVVPFNILKGLVVSIISLILYKYIRPILEVVKK